MCTSPRTALYSLRKVLLLYGVLLVAASMAILYRSWEVQVTEHEFWSEKATQQVVRSIEIMADRGKILDRFGRPIAQSDTRYEIGIAPREIPGTEERMALVRDLVDLIGLTRERALQLTEGDRTWSVVPGRHSVAVRVELSEHRGVHFIPQVARSYPYGDVALPILGRLGQDGQVFGGIEHRFDTLLTGIPGVTQVYTDVRGQRRRARVPGNREAVPGRDVRLTIDIELQASVEAILKDVVDIHRAEGADVVVLDPHNGDVLAISSIGRDGESTGTAVSVPFEPGSSFKPFTLAELFSQSMVTWADTVDGKGGVAMVEGRRLTDVARRDRVTLLEAFAVSSNIILAKLAYKLEEQDQHRILDEFGFGQRTGIALPGESRGVLRPPEQWTRPSQGSLAIGYEASVTPIQLAVAYAALANGGHRLRPRLIHSVQGADPDAFAPDTLGRPIAEPVAQALQRGLAVVVSDGSGASADLGPYPFGGKTGTSRAWSQGGYSGYFSSFVGIFPADRPRFVIVARVLRPSAGAYYGGLVAAPIAKEIVENLLGQGSSLLESATLPSDSVELAHIGVAEALGGRHEERDAIPQATMALPTLRVTGPPVNVVDSLN